MGILLPNPVSSSSATTKLSGILATCLNDFDGPPTSSRYFSSTKKSPAGGSVNLCFGAIIDATKVSRTVPISFMVLNAANISVLLKSTLPGFATDLGDFQPLYRHLTMAPLSRSSNIFIIVLRDTSIFLLKD